MAAENKQTGIKAGPGRPKGSVNKVPGEVKAMILAALDGVGGIAYLQERANDPRTQTAFLSLVGKVLPLQVTGENGGPIQVQAIERTVVDSK